jgi:hypothetical protein
MKRSWNLQLSPCEKLGCAKQAHRQMESSEQDWKRSLRDYGEARSKNQNFRILPRPIKSAADGPGKWFWVPLDLKNLKSQKVGQPRSGLPSPANLPLK